MKIKHTFKWFVGVRKNNVFRINRVAIKKKFVTIDLWRNTDKRSLVEVAYASLHPVLYWGTLLFSFLFVIISILMTNTVNLGLSKFLHSIWILPVGFISLVVAAVQLVAIKTEIVYSWLLANLFLKIKF